MTELYKDKDLIFCKDDEKYYLINGNDSYTVSDHLYEPYLCIMGDDRKIIIHNSFTVRQLCDAIDTKGSLMMITGHKYDVSGIFKLILKAIELSRESVDIGFVEGHCYIDYLKQHKAVSKESAVDLSRAGVMNPNVMNPFLHSKIVGRTENGLFYLRDKEYR